MIQLFTTGLRIVLVAVAMTLSIPAITFAQATESPTESSPIADPGAVDNAFPTPGAASTDNDTSAQSDPFADPVSATAIEVESQRRLNEFRSEYLDDRADTLSQWLDFVAIVLTFFAIAIAIAGFLGFRSFREIKTEARESVAAAKQHEITAKEINKRLEGLLSESEERVQLIRNLTAEGAVNDPDTNQAVKNVRENPEASLTDKAIAEAVSLQQQGKIEAAIEKWRAVAHIAEGIDDDLASRAWFSIGYLIQPESLEDCISAYDQAIRLKPDYVGAYNNRGIAKVELGRHEDAIADYDQAIRLKPDLAETYSNRGNAKAALGWHVAAIVDYDEAIRLKRDLAKTYSNRGNAKAALGRHTDAIVDHDEAIRLEPGSAKAYNNRGIAKVELGRHEDAIADFDEAIRLEPGYAEAYSNRGNAKAALGRHTDAIVDHDEAIRLKPDFVKAYNNRGVAKAALGRHEDAIADYDQAVCLKPDYAEAYSNRGNTKGTLGRHTDAIVDHDEAIRLKPDYAEAYSNLGNAKAALGRHTDAIADYDQAIRLKPDYAKAYSNRGNTKGALGLKDEARKDFETALELARNATNANIVAKVEQLLRDLDAAGDS